MEDKTSRPELQKLTSKLRLAEFRTRLAGGKVTEVLQREGIEVKLLPKEFVEGLATLSPEELDTLANVNLKLKPDIAAGGVDGGILF
jgi:hypothetical protein